MSFLLPWDWSGQDQDHAVSLQTSKVWNGYGEIYWLPFLVLVVAHLHHLAQVSRRCVCMAETALDAWRVCSLEAEPPSFPQKASSRVQLRWEVRTSQVGKKGLRWHRLCD